MIPSDHLAFVDLETSGLSPGSDRITEIGVVTVDGSGSTEWTTLINPGARSTEHSRLYNGIAHDVVKAAPRFQDIAVDLSRRLAGRIFIAHNARFDFGFLRAEFRRAGIEFQPQVLCSVMLSRKLYPAHTGHDLDTLMLRHGLKADVRHRALPDARLVWQFWQVLQAEHPQERLSDVIEALLAGPVLPARLDPSLIDRLPEAPGIFIMRGNDDAILHAGKAGNLKLHALNYFRLDRTSQKALDVSQRVTNITWRTTRGAIGAHLKLKALAAVISPAHKKRGAQTIYSWRLMPGKYPCIELIRLSERSGDDECYGMFESERKAHNALLRLAMGKNLCHAILGIRETPAASCTACAANDRLNCGLKTARIRQFTKAVVALAPLRVIKWPYDGPIGVRERSDLHIIDNWRYLGTAQSESEIHHVLETRRDDFDEDTFAFISKTLSRLPPKRILRLPAGTDAQFILDPS